MMTMNTVITHIGNDPNEFGGGISSVIRQHLSRQLPGFSQSYIATYSSSRRSIVDRLRAWLGAARQILRSCDRQIFHFHLSQRGSLVREGSLLFLARLMRRPTVATLHASSALQQNGVEGRITSLILGQARTVHLLSDEHLRKLGKLADAHTIVIPNDVEPIDRPRPMAYRDQAVLFAGRIGTRKGADLMQRAWSSANRENRWKLLLAGPIDDAFEHKLRDWIANDQSVSYLGLLDRESLLHRLDDVQIAVLPSRSEALPMFALEAMSRGAVFVGTSVGGVASLLLDGEAGQLVEPDNAQSLASNLILLMNDPKHRLRLAEAGYRRIVQYASSSVVNKSWLAIYEGVL